MSTNYYLHHLTDAVDDWDDPLCHLGNSMPAGFWCYDCNVRAIERVCPMCGAEYQPSCWEELFTTHDSSGHTRKGVMRTFKFVFAQSPEDIYSFPGDWEVIDEYDNVMTMDEFRTTVLRVSRVWSIDYVGRWF